MVERDWNCFMFYQAAWKCPKKFVMYFVVSKNRLCPSVCMNFYCFFSRVLTLPFNSTISPQTRRETCGKKRPRAPLQTLRLIKYASQKCAAALTWVKVTDMTRVRLLPSWLWIGGWSESSTLWRRFSVLARNWWIFFFFSFFLIYWRLNRKCLFAASDHLLDCGIWPWLIFLDTDCNWRLS